MKAMTYIILALGFSVTGCSSQKKIVEKAPFDTGAATSQFWAGGRAESGSGTLLHVPILSSIGEDVVFEKAYFRGMVADIELTTVDGKTLASANFTNSVKKPDILMHSDPKKEVGNRPPKPKAEMPFEMQNDECALSYMENGTLKYIRIQNVKEKKPMMAQ